VTGEGNEEGRFDVNVKLHEIGEDVVSIRRLLEEDDGEEEEEED
jgi:hypothetical protein